MHIAIIGFLKKSCGKHGKRNRPEGYRRIRIASIAVLFSLLLAGSVALVHAKTYVFTLKWALKVLGTANSLVLWVLLLEARETCM